MAGLVNKVKNVLSHDDSTPASAGTHNHSSATNTAERAAHDVSSHSTGSHNVGTTPHSHSTDSTLTGDRSTTATTGRTENTLERGAEHLKEHAHPPHHSHNQPRQDGLLDETDAKRATHDHQHLAPVTHETRHHHEVEEVERQRDIDRHVHHVQHHVQPVLDSQHAAEVHQNKVVPETHIKENHVATDEDKAQFAALNTAQNTVQDAGREKTIIDRGEKVHEHTSHHVHHVVQPEIIRDTHEHVRQHTTVPIHQTTHEAPIVHQSTLHEPLQLNEFVKGGGVLDSSIKHDHNLLNVTGKDCDRTVDGPAETLVSNLGLQSGNTAQTSTTGATSSSSGPVGTTGGRI